MPNMDGVWAGGVGLMAAKIACRIDFTTPSCQSSNMPVTLEASRSSSRKQQPLFGTKLEPSEVS